MSAKTRILGEDDVRTLLPMQTCIGLMESALRKYSAGDLTHPLRPIMKLGSSPGALGLMPAFDPDLSSIVTKLIAIVPQPPDSPYDSHQGVVLLLDSASGMVRGILDAASITEIRTAAATGVATRLLAKKTAATLCILGAGVQARSHIEAVTLVRPIEEIRIWNRTSARAQRRAEEALAVTGIKPSVIETPEKAVRGADIICTVTGSKDPILEHSWLEPGCHVNAVGSSSPDARELDTQTVSSATVFVDSRESALNEAGDLLTPIQENRFAPDRIAAEIGDILLGRHAGRQDEQEITMFKSLGIAIEDLVAAHHVVAEAETRNAGTLLYLGGLRNPH